MTVTGAIETAKPRPDGDVHIRLRLDPQFATMLNARNMSEERGDLVVEPVCATRPTKRRTVEEGSCDKFSQNFDRSLVGQHVRVVGAYVTDMDKGWNEIHPVTSITPD